MNKLQRARRTKKYIISYRYLTGWENSLGDKKWGFGEWIMHSHTPISNDRLILEIHKIAKDHERSPDVVFITGITELK